jgi:uncharacterized protein (TIGR02466 family)
MDFTNIFSTYLYIKKCNINLSSLSNHINKTKKIDRKGAQISNYGGWQSKNFGETNSYTKPLFNVLNTAVEEVKNKIEYRHNLRLHSYWYNINYEDSFNIPHIHMSKSCMNIVVSGVFYIETPKDCGKIVFKRNDQLTGLMYEESVNRYNEYNSSVWIVNPVKNLCVLFPANLEHFVKPNLNKKKRISISFNYGL